MSVKVSAFPTVRDLTPSLERSSGQKTVHPRPSNPIDVEAALVAPQWPILDRSETGRSRGNAPSRGGLVFRPSGFRVLFISSKPSHEGLWFVELLALQRGLRNLEEYDRTEDLAPFHPMERLLHIVNRDRLGHEPVQIQSAL